MLRRSLGCKVGDLLAMLKRWLQHYWYINEPLLVKQPEWDIVYVADDERRALPRQEGSCDCGIFTMMYAYYLSCDLVMTFSQKDMQHLRTSCSFATDAVQAPQSHSDTTSTNSWSGCAETTAVAECSARSCDRDAVMSWRAFETRLFGRTSTAAGIEHLVGTRSYMNV